MKHVLMILTLCLTLMSSAFAMSFTDITTHEFQGSTYSVVAWGDVDGNGYADLFIGTESVGESRLYLNTGFGWNLAEEDYNVSAINHVRSARFVDFDQDGHLDLFCLTGNEEGAELYHSTANQRFQRVDLNLNDQSDETIRSAVWCDADYDGNLDLFLSNRSELVDEGVLLVRSQEEFVEVRAAEGPFTQTLVNQVSAVDFDRDGDMDYFMSKADGSVGLWSDIQSGGFRDYGPSMNFPIKVAGENITWSDFDHDGNLDFYACGSAGNNCLFYQYDGENGMPCSFENMTDAFDLRELTVGVTSAHAIDANCDGWADLFLVRNTGNLLLINHGGQGWQQMERATELLQPNRDTHSAAWADFDNDGDMDCAMAQGRNGLKLFRNDTPIEREYVGLKLCGSDNCMTPVLNCLVEVIFPIGKQWASTSMYASTVGGDGLTQIVYNPTWMHSEVWTVNVLWPNGAVTTLDESSIPLNGTTELHMPYAPTPGNHEYVVAPSMTPEVVNYPNPFNPTTSIEFTLSESAYITLSIYNLLGQEVANLASGTYEAGLHSLTFDAAALPSGLYLARLESPSGTVVHRMLLTK